jgi:hypothetical protein
MPLCLSFLCTTPAITTPLPFPRGLPGGSRRQRSDPAVRDLRLRRQRPRAGTAVTVVAPDFGDACSSY